MTLRQHFAAMAMQGLITTLTGTMATAIKQEAEKLGVGMSRQLAATAVAQADALLTELEKQK